jgi:hypothetical protein
MLVLLALFLVALHCLAYSALRGVEDDPATALLWAIVNVGPFLIAFELGKALRAGAPTPRSDWFRLAALGCGTVALSILLQRLVGWETSGVAFEAVRRLPALVLLAAAWLAGLAPPLRAGNPVAPGEGEDSILASSAFDWVRAAGNYVELKIDGRSVMIRLTMQQAETLLQPRGFLRIHRSVLVRTAAVADYRCGKAQDEIRLRCGTTFKVGEKYRVESAARFAWPRVA